MNWREIIEAIVVIACGVLLLSPEFNTIFQIPFIAFIAHVPDEVISHLAFGLVPIIILYFIYTPTKRFLELLVLSIQFWIQMREFSNLIQRQMILTNTVNQVLKD